MSPLTLAARGVRKSFGGVEVLHGVDLDVAGGSILALLGENGAGKSTLVKILAGEYTPDSAEIEIGGQVYGEMNPRSARAAGIRMIFQEFQDAPPLSVAENVSLGRLPTRAGFVVSKSRMRKRAARVLDDMNVELDLDAPVASLRIGERQVVEIARALSDEAKVLILDEPTAALSHQEVDALFRYLRNLRDRGVAIIYITHRLDEVSELSDKVEVLRDGEVAVVGETSSFDRPALVSAMIGRAAAALGRPAPREWELGSKPAIEFRDAALEGVFEGVSFSVYPGEIVAVYGQLGSGSAELAECTFGLRRLSQGVLRVRGRPGPQKGPAQAIRLGVGFVPPDRKSEAIFAVRPVCENISAPSWPRLSIGRILIRRLAESRAYRRWHDELHIRSRNDPLQPIITLSGGNQQKVVLGRWLECGTPVLVMVEPTRGVDVGARAELYRAMRQLARRGIAILISTSDYEEVTQVADRAFVLARGKLVSSLEDDEITTGRLLAAAGG
jgi:ribose transport system ATP-binding protein